MAEDLHRPAKRCLIRPPSDQAGKRHLSPIPQRKMPLRGVLFPQPNLEC